MRISAMDRVWDCIRQIKMLYTSRNSYSLRRLDSVVPRDVLLRMHALYAERTHNLWGGGATLI